MTMEELVIAIRVTAESAQEDIEQVTQGLAMIGRTGTQSMAQLRRETAEAISAIERMQKDAFRFALLWIDQRRRTGALTAKEEIAELQRVRDEYAFTAEQIISIDQKIYEARKALRENEEGQIDALYGSVTQALTARYEEQRSAEKSRIAESIAAWQTWSDETCAAIRKQMEALDQQAQEQERAKTAEAYLRDIDRLESALLFERDDYNRMQLEKQLARVKDTWAQVQSGWAKEDEHAALEQQMEAAAQRAQAEIEALQAESKRIDTVYDELLKGQSIAAEAQKVLLESTQEELLGLLNRYAPDYEATGKSLGARMYEGFVQAFGDAGTWFEAFNAQFEEMTAHAQAAAFGVSQSLVRQGQAQANLSAPTIQQTVNFNQPVDSPADVARRMQQVSEELARRL